MFIFRYVRFVNVFTCISYIIRFYIKQGDRRQKKPPKSPDDHISINYSPRIVTPKCTSPTLVKKSIKHCSLDINWTIKFNQSLRSYPE